MHYVTDLSSYQTENKTAVTLGKFDGLHRGHQELIRRIKNVQTKRRWKVLFLHLIWGKRR